MTTGKALNGKPYVGNPHVRFDEGEVTSAEKPRYGSLLYKLKKSLFQGGRKLAVVVASVMSAVYSFAAQTYYADWKNGSDSNDGLSTAKAFKSFERLVEAVNDGGSGSTGILAEGEYLLAYGPTCTVENATFKGAVGLRDKTVIDGQGQWRCLYNVKAYATVANLTIRRGFLDNPGGYANADGNGDGLYLASRSINGLGGGDDHFAFVTNCVFDSCTNMCCGSALAVSGGAKVIDCLFTNCWTSTTGGERAGNSGGGARGGTAFVTLPWATDALFERCVFVDNAAAKGAGGISSGLYNPSFACTNYSGIVLKDCQFLRNRSGDYGGAVLAKVREATRCHFVSNYAALGSGAFNGPEVYFNSSGSDIAPWLAYYTNLLVDCTFIGNSSGGKGGAYSPGLYAWACLSNCTFRGNSSEYYGTLYMVRRMMSISDKDNAAPPMLGYKITGCTFEGNETLSDDGTSNSLMYSRMTPVVVDGCLFESNKSPSWASAVSLGSNSVVRNCMFIGNQTVGGTGKQRFGGAVFFEGPNGLVEGSLFVGNTNLTSVWGCCINANGNGYNNAGQGLKVHNCTFVRNGRGVMYGAHGTVTADKMVGAATVNCIFWQNASDFAYDVSWYGCTNCYANVDRFATGENGNIKGTDPKFANPNVGDWTLGRGSPCKNKGVNADWMLNAVDLVGNPRIDHFVGIVDIGCYESRILGMVLSFR